MSDVLISSVHEHGIKLAVHGEQIAELREHGEANRQALKEFRDEVADMFREHRDEVARLRHTLIGFAFTFAVGIAGLIATLLVIAERGLPN